MIIEVKLKLPNGTEMVLTVNEWKLLQVQLNSLFGAPHNPIGRLVGIGDKVIY